MTADRLTTEVVRHNLTYISEEMGIALRKSAYSPNIRERADHSCAILDSTGRTIGQAEHIPVHIGSLPLGLRNTLQFLERNGVNPAPGDMFVLNDPYLAGTHLNDVTTIRPIFLDASLVGYAANKAHHTDVGGMTPASINPFSTELTQEGIVIPPVKLLEGNELRTDILRIFTSNTRMPDVTLGDLRAQIASNLLGERRLVELVSKLGLSTFHEACESVLDQTYNLAVSEYAKMAKGKWKGEDFLELTDRLIRIKAEVMLDGKGIQVDFTGTDAQVPASLNAVLGVSVAAVTYVVRTLMPTEMPSNDGFNRTIQVKAPEGTVVNPTKPAPVAGGNVETSQRIADVVYKALAEGMPDKMPAASHGSMNNVMMGGVEPETGKMWAFYETNGGGSGARPWSDGVDGIQVNMTNTLNTPIEVIEHYYPVQFESYGIRRGSAGLGEWRGGNGIERSFTAKATIQVTLLGDRCKIRPWGLRGGLPGETSEYSIRKLGGNIIRLGSKETIVLSAGDTLMIRTAGGGGYGNPRKRSILYIQEDVDNEYLTQEQARLLTHPALHPEPDGKS